MALKTFKPYTKSTRGTILVDRAGLWKGKPFKALVEPKNSMRGRNNNGHITSRNMSGVDTRKCIGWLISTERKSTCQALSKELNMIQIDLATSC